MTGIRNTKEIKLNKLFAGVEAELIDSVFKAEKFSEVKEGEIIYQTGDESDFLYLLLRGDVKIKFLPYNYISNKIFNDFFGEKEIFDKTRRNSSAVADSKCLLYMLDKTIVEDLLKRSPAFKKNIDVYGEIDLPEMELITNDRIDLTQIDKPVSFKAAPSKHSENDSADSNNSNDEISNIISSIIRENNPIPDSNIFKDTEEEIEINIDEGFNIEIDDNFTLQETEPEKTEEKPVEEKKPADQTDTNKILKVLNRIQVHSNLPLVLQAIIDETKQLTASTAGEIYLVDESLDVIVKFIIEDGSENNVRYRSSEGLTGTCVLQKKIINFENPVEDSRFVQAIDQPGDGNLKKIIYLPLINEEQKIIAVLQLAREEGPYSDIEIRHLDMLKTQMAIAIERCKRFESAVEDEKRKFNKNIDMFLTDNFLIPLDLINRYSYILSSDDVTQPIKSVISLLQQQANLLWDIVQSAIDSKREIKLDKEELNINSYINNISELLAEYCDARNINFFKKNGKDAKVSLDRGKIFMAIYQIVRNACDFSVADSNVYVSTEVKDNTVHIRIRDEGTGISEAMKDKIFNTGYSKDKGRNRLGMAIAKKIVDAHNAQITFKSSTNKGTTFRISIPVYTSSE